MKEKNKITGLTLDISGNKGEQEAKPFDAVEKDRAWKCCVHDGKRELTSETTERLHCASWSLSFSAHL